MSTESDFYTIDELAQLSGVKVRNIRYYIAEGLLDLPEERGRYTRSHLLRLRYIRRLSRQFVRLEQIRKALQRTDAEIETLLDTATEEDALAEESLPLPEEAPGEQARRYIAHALGKTLPPAASESREKEDFAGAVESEALTAPFSQKMRRASSSLREPSGEDYQRIVLQEGLELHVRTPITPEMRALIVDLIALAQKPRTS